MRPFPPQDSATEGLPSALAPFLESMGCIVLAFVAAFAANAMERATLGFKVSWLLPGLALALLRIGMRARPLRASAKPPLPLGTHIALGLFQIAGFSATSHFGGTWLNHRLAKGPVEERWVRLVSLPGPNVRSQQRAILRIQMDTKHHSIHERDRVDRELRPMARMVPGELVRIRLRQGGLGLPILVSDKAWDQLSPKPERRIRNERPPLPAGISLEGPLKEALGRGDFESLQALIESGADPNALNNDGKPFFFSALSFARLKLLVAHGADLKRRDPQGRSILFELADEIWMREPSEDSLNAVKFCLRHGADPQVRDPSGTSAWEYMRRSSSCHDPLYWDLETRLLVEDPGNPLLAKEGEPFDFELEGPRVHLDLEQPSFFQMNDLSLVRWQQGDRWYASELRIKGAQAWAGFAGELANGGILSLCGDRQPGSLQAQGETWSVKERDGQTTHFPAPRLRIVVVKGKGFQLEPDEAIPAHPSTRPSLAVDTFRAEVVVPSRTAWLPIPPEADPASARIRYGRWVFRKK